MPRLVITCLGYTNILLAYIKEVHFSCLFKRHMALKCPTRDTAPTRNFVIFQKSDMVLKCPIRVGCHASVSVRHVPDTITTFILVCLCFIGGHKINHCILLAPHPLFISFHSRAFDLHYRVWPVLVMPMCLK